MVPIDVESLIITEHNCTRVLLSVVRELCVRYRHGGLRHDVRGAGLCDRLPPVRTTESRGAASDTVHLRVRVTDPDSVVMAAVGAESGSVLDRHRHVVCLRLEPWSAQNPHEW